MQTYTLHTPAGTVDGLSSDHLRDLGTIGRISPTDLVSRSGGRTKSPARDVPGLAELLSDEPQASKGDAAALLEKSLFELELEFRKSLHDNGARFDFTSSGVRYIGIVVPSGIHVSAPIQKLTARQLDDSRLLERVLRVASSCIGCSVCLDDDDVLMIQSARPSEDLDDSEVKAMIVGVVATFQELAERVAHLL